MKHEIFKNLIAQEFLRQRSNSTLRQLVEIVGLDLFSALLFNSNLQGRHIVFPKKSSLQRLIIATKIKSELRYLKPGSRNFRNKVSMLARLYNLRPFKVLEIFRTIK